MAKYPRFGYFSSTFSIGHVSCGVNPPCSAPVSQTIPQGAQDLLDYFGLDPLYGFYVIIV
jgi:hypothetical protein